MPILPPRGQKSRCVRAACRLDQLRCRLGALRDGQPAGVELGRTRPREEANSDLESARSHGEGFAHLLGEAAANGEAPSAGAALLTHADFHPFAIESSRHPLRRRARPRDGEASGDEIAVHS